MSEEMMPNATEVALTAPSLADLKPKMKLRGRVKRLELYGAFIDVGLPADAMIHISQISKERINRVSDVLNVGDEISVWIDRVDPERGQLSVTMIEPLAADWNELEEGQEYAGTITRLEQFGVFVNIGAPKEGLVHISELSHDYIKHPSEILKIGDEVQVKLLGFNKKKRRIDLSIKALLAEPVQEEPLAIFLPEPVEEEQVGEDEEEEMPTAMEIALRRALGQKGDKRSGGNRKGDWESHGRRRRERLRQQQEDLLSRTLASREM